MNEDKEINERKKELDGFMQVCGSCENFISYMAESGFCLISKCNCICKNPSAMIDMWDNKCEKWILNKTYNEL